MAPPFPTPSDGVFETLSWEHEPGFYRPDYERGLTGVMPSIFELLGRRVAGSVPALLPEGAPRRARHVLFVCVDGLGFKELARAPRLGDLWAEYGTWITSVFPSITSAALTSIFQALPPSRHGLTGHEIYKREVGAVVDLLRMQVVGAEAPLSAAGVDVTRFAREPGWLDSAAARSVASLQLLPRHIAGSGLSVFSYGATPLAGYGHPVEGLSTASRFVAETDSGWVGLYIPTIDSLAHSMGGDTPEMEVVLHEVEALLGFWAAHLPSDRARDTVVVIATDHGHSDIRRRIPLYGEAGEWLWRNARAVGFSGRVMHVYTGGDDSALHVIEDGLGELVGDAGLVLPFEAVESLAGPRRDGAARDWVRSSLGDVLVILRDGYNWQKRDPSTATLPYGGELLSQHGGLTWNEMIVPFIVAPAEAMVDWRSAA